MLPFPPSGLLSPTDQDELQPSHIVYYELPQVRSTPGQRERGPAVVVLAAAGQEKDLAKLQEAIGVSLKTGEVPDRDEVLGGAVRRIMERVRSEADQAELARIRAAVRRSVPFFMRSWFTAYLLKAQLPFGQGSEKAAPFQGRQPRDAQREPPRAGSAPGREPSRAGGAPGRGAVARRAGRRGGRGSRWAGRASPRGASRGKPSRVSRPVPSRACRDCAGAAGGIGRRAHRPPPADRSGLTQLFVNIGRNRKVFARDLTELFTSTLQLTPAEIGEVRVFDKYSFVDIASARAADAIARLSGVELKGRPITVNYAKKKEEKEAR